MALDSVTELDVVTNFHVAAILTLRAGSCWIASAPRQSRPCEAQGTWSQLIPMKNLQHSLKKQTDSKKYSTSQFRYVILKTVEVEMSARKSDTWTHRPSLCLRNRTEQEK